MKHKMATVKWFLCLYLQCSADDQLKGRTLQELERDVEEASARLAMAHKEIRRLTDELESAHLTQKAYGKSLHWSHTWETLTNKLRSKSCFCLRTRAARSSNGSCPPAPRSGETEMLWYNLFTISLYCTSQLNSLIVWLFFLLDHFILVRWFFSPLFRSCWVTKDKKNEWETGRRAVPR